MFDVVYDVVRQNGKNSPQNCDVVRLRHIVYDIVRFSYYIIRFTYDVAYDMTYDVVQNGKNSNFLYDVVRFTQIVYEIVRERTMSYTT